MLRIVTKCRGFFRFTIGAFSAFHRAPARTITVWTTEDL
jgi:hypothetical protein